MGKEKIYWLLNVCCIGGIILSYLSTETFIAVTLVFTGILIFETIRYAIKVKRGEPAGSPFLSPKGKHGIRLYV